MIVAALTGLTLSAGIASTLWQALKQPERPEPTGPYLVGTRLFSLPPCSDAREPQTPIARADCTLSFRVWYPAARATDETLPTVNGRVASALARLYGMPFSLGYPEPSHSYVDARVAPGGPFPLILFSHAGFSEKHQNLSTMEELASHGFVVASVAHPGESVMTLFPDGTHRAIDEELSQIIQVLRRTPVDLVSRYEETLFDLIHQTDRTQAVEAARKLGDLHEKMFSGVDVSLRELLEARQRHLDRVYEALRTSTVTFSHPLFGAIDLDAVGVMGHSLGGYSAIRFALRHPEVLATVAYDAIYFLRAEEPAPQLTRPLLSIHAESTAVARGVSVATEGANRYLSPDEAAHENRSAVLRGAAHMSFCDFSLLPRVFQWMGMLGRVDGAQAVRETNRLTREFFSKELLGHETGDKAAGQRELDRETVCESEIARETARQRGTGREVVCEQEIGGEESPHEQSRREESDHEESGHEESDHEESGVHFSPRLDEAGSLRTSERDAESRPNQASA